MSHNLWEKLIDQERARSALKKIYLRDAYPPGIIFFGQKGIGKEAHAIAFAQSINCEKGSFTPCGTCERCIRVANFLSPDIRLVYPAPASSSDKTSYLNQVEKLLEKKKSILT